MDGLSSDRRSFAQARRGRGVNDVKIALVAAVAENGVIGRNGDLPWRIPADLKYFKKVTLGKPIIMGRKTFESIGRPLPDRQNFVVSRDAEFEAKGVTVCSDLDAAMEAAIDAARQAGVSEAAVIGGETLYRATLARADRLYLTRVRARPDGDTWFPEFDLAAWNECSREPAPEDARADYPCEFVVLERKKTEKE